MVFQEAVALGHIVQRHQGGLEVQSEPGKGTKFRLTLPRRHTAQPVPASD